MIALRYGALQEVEQSREYLTEDDLSSIEGLSPHRAAERLSARALLREELRVRGLPESENRLLYSSSGAPYIENSELHISISHSPAMVAIVISDAPCGVDIECVNRNFAAIKSRFCRPSEELIAPLPLIWSAKEAVYKIKRRPGVELLRDIEIIAADSSSITTSENITLQHSSTLAPGHIIVWG
ncbi:MAG: 4'-phosphopantetheinyl transferase superfamily protein [Rikenellaceae bacterium]